MDERATRDDQFPTFDCLNDLEVWLDRLDYNAFWSTILPHAVVLPTRDRCEDMIACGAVSEADIMFNLRHMAASQIAERYNLKWEDRTPFLFAS